MTEPELLKHLSKLELDSRVLEIKIKIWKDEQGKSDLIKRNEAVKAEIENLKRKLGSPDDKKHGEEEQIAKTDPELVKHISKLE